MISLNRRIVELARRLESWEAKPVTPAYSGAQDVKNAWIRIVLPTLE